MFARETQCRDQTQKSRKNDQNPSFSSTLLDEIYRSIDGNADETNGYDPSVSSRRRTSFVEKWMEKEKEKQRKKHQEVDIKPAHDNDVVFFSSTSSSSDSSGALSSSDTEFFGPTVRTKQKTSCFTGRPKPVRTEPTRVDHRTRTGPVEDDLFKSKSRALKIYANLKKVKQPISPGGRLTSFINSLFSNSGAKKSKSLESRSTMGPVRECLSASSFSRSFMNKYAPQSRDGERRPVRIEPPTEVVKKDSRPSGRSKSVYSGDSGRFGRPPLPPVESSKKVEIVVQKQNSKRGGHGGYYNVDEYDEEDDCFSDTSSDLFELDHLTFFGSNRYSEELPVYETTRLDTNRAIGSRLLR